jgi:hypothetical protein
MGMMMGKRKFPRAPIQVPATCVVGQDRISGTVWQIGEGGLFVELPSGASVAGPVAVQFDLPGAGGQRVVAEAAWSCDKPLRFAPKASGGFGLKFSEIAPTTRKSIAGYVRKMKQTYESLQFALALDRPTPQLPSLLRDTGLHTIRDRKELKDYVAQVIAQFRAIA